jgi:membrane protease subunit HflK
METIDPQKNEVWKKVKGLLKKSGIAAVLVVAIPVIGFGSLYNIQEQEQAVVTTMGKASAVTEPGLHFKVPFVQNVKKVNTTIQGFAIGYDPNDNESKEEDSLMITKDYNFVNVDFFVEYKVADPVRAVYASEDPLKVLQSITKSCIRTVIGSYDVDSVLTTGKNEIQSKIKQMIMEKLEGHDIGLTVVNVTIQDSEPPTQEVMEAFKAVETAKQGKETAINNANKYRNEKLPEATAQTDKILQDAESSKAKRINEASAEVAKFNAMYIEYQKNPEVTKKRMFYETMEKVLPDMKVIIDGTDKTNTILPLDSFVGGSADASTSGEKEKTE